MPCRPAGMRSRDQLFCQEGRGYAQAAAEQRVNHAQIINHARQRMTGTKQIIGLDKRMPLLIEMRDQFLGLDCRESRSAR